MSTPEKSPVGLTSSKMRSAPIGAYYVWVNSSLYYPKALARHVGRVDLQILRPSDLSAHSLEKLLGRTPLPIVLDHACQEMLSNEELLGYHELRRRYEAQVGRSR